MVRCTQHRDDGDIHLMELVFSQNEAVRSSKHEDRLWFMLPSRVLEFWNEFLPYMHSLYVDLVSAIQVIDVSFLILCFCSENEIQMMQSNFALLNNNTLVRAFSNLRNAFYLGCDDLLPFSVVERRIENSHSL